jgi:hypothetical protein
MPALASAQSVGTTQTLAPLAGPQSTPAAGQAGIGFFGTDLGYTVKHNGALRILFGDTQANSLTFPIGVGADDAQGTISLSSFPNGAAVDAYVAAHPAPAGKPSWQAAAPPVVFRTNLLGFTAPMSVLRDGALLEMGVFRAPTAAFSNASDAAFAIFDRNVPTECSGGLFPSCSDGMTCDRGMGSCFGFTGEDDVPCVLGTTRCLCLPVVGGGMCQDRTSPMYNTSEDGRTMSIALRTEVANASQLIDEVYYSQSWFTNKFVNPSVRTVNDFDPARANGSGNDYRPADGVAPTTNEKVLIWGRPNFVGMNASSMSSKLFFAYADMPHFDVTGHFRWAPQYFAGMNANNTPRFSPRQQDAVALDLSAQGDKSREKYDIVNQMSVSFVPALDKWVMLYGGDLPADVLQFLAGPNFSRVVRDGQGAIHARFAARPWGPWSAPVDVLAGGDPSVSPPVAGTQYAPGGILFHPGCSGSQCVPSDPAAPANTFGRLYGANVIDAWTTARPNGGADLYWNVSTWNPYQVVLMKTRLLP